MVREPVPEPSQSLIHVFRFRADIVAAVVVGVFRREPMVEDAVIVALVQNEDAVVDQGRVEFSQGLASVLLGKEVGEGITQADHGVELVVNVAGQPAPVGLDGPHDEPMVPCVLEGLGQHLRAPVRADDVEPGLEELNGMEAGAGGHVQDPFGPSFLEEPDEKIPFG